jgi:hypothetical protein
MDKENKIILDAGDEAELVNTCKQIWKQEKNRGLRYIQKLSKKVLIAFK